MIGGISYAWSIRRKGTRVQKDYPGGRITVAIEVAEGPSKKLIVHTATPHPENSFGVQPVGIRPSDVRRWIEESIRLGWTSTAEVWESENGALRLREGKPSKTARVGAR